MKTLLRVQLRLSSQTNWQYRSKALERSLLFVSWQAHLTLFITLYEYPIREYILS
jgi:hypothetical protein